MYDFSGLDEAGVAYEQVLQCTAGQILTSPTDEDIDDFDEPENGWTKVQNPDVTFLYRKDERLLRPSGMQE